MVTLKRRFRAFEGISLGGRNIIQNGIRRLGLGDVKWTTGGVADLNQRMLKEASERSSLQCRWDRALLGKNPRPEMREGAASNYAPRSLALVDTIKALAIQGVLGGAFWGSRMLEGLSSNATTAISGALIVGMLIAAPKLVTSAYMLLKNGSLEGSMKQVGYAVIDTLHHTGMIRTAPRNIELRVTKEFGGSVRCHIEGASNLERHHFNSAMAQALGPCDNDRYILVRNSYLGSLLRVDYHPVPAAFAKHKKTATFYHKRWNKYVGSSKLVYTRTPEGRAQLLKARFKSSASFFQKKTDIRSVWE